MHLESLGLDLTYWTDVDLHARPELLANHRCLFSLGHDEYWSQPMRQGAAQANANGVNLAFLGANACYRQIRLEPSSVGPNRLQVCYKSAAEDPMAAHEPSLTTVNWAQAPVNDPESTLIGSMYQSVGAKADMVVTDASSWFYDGCNLRDGHAFPKVILGEYDRYVPSYPGPRNADVLAHSPVPGQGNWSDVTYYTAPGNGGGVLASGSASFVGQISTTGVIPPIVIPGPFPGVSDVFRRAMENVYARFGLGPASSYGASSGNWSEVYTGSAAAARQRRRHPLRLTLPPGRRRGCHHSRRPPPYDRPTEMGNTDESRSRARRPLAWSVLAVAGLAGLVLSACSSSPPHQAAAKVALKPTTTTSTTAPAPPCPLTGLPAPFGVPQRPAMAVKIDNYPDGRPRRAWTRPTSCSRSRWRAASPATPPCSSARTWPSSARSARPATSTSASSGSWATRSRHTSAASTRCWPTSTPPRSSTSTWGRATRCRSTRPAGCPPMPTSPRPPSCTARTRP